MHTVEALDSLILFRQKPDSLLRRLMSSEEAVRVAAQGELVALAVENGWQGDLWRCYIARELASSENPFSLAWERHSGGQDTLEALALADMKLFFELLNAPPEGGATLYRKDLGQNPGDAMIRYDGSTLTIKCTGAINIEAGGAITINGATIDLN